MSSANTKTANRIASTYVGVQIADALTAAATAQRRSKSQQMALYIEEGLRRDGYLQDPAPTAAVSR